VALQCAQAVSEVAKVAGDSTAPYVQDLLAGLLTELPGRLWEVGLVFLLFQFIKFRGSSCQTLD
jgi:hypothetical protein